MQFFPRPGSSEQGFSLPAYPAEVRDVSGAGDTVSAVLSVSLAQKADYKTAAELSNRAAAVVVAKPHTAIVSAAELLEIGLRP